MRLNNGTYALRSLADADDHAPANDADVLSFAQAQKHALALQDQAKRDEGIITGPVTVREAAEKYVAWFRQHRKSVNETEHAINPHTNSRISLWVTQSITWARSPIPAGGSPPKCEVRGP